MKVIVESVENNELKNEFCFHYDESEGVIGCSIYW